MIRLKYFFLSWLKCILNVSPAFFIIYILFKIIGNSLYLIFLYWENPSQCNSGISKDKPMHKDENVSSGQHDKLMTCLQLLSSLLALLNISLTWASPLNILAWITYRTLCLFFSEFWLASTFDSLARGLRIRSKRPLPCLLYCTSFGTAQHGWPCYAVASSL